MRTLIGRIRERVAGTRRSFQQGRGTRSLASRLRGAARYAIRGAGRGG